MIPNLSHLSLELRGVKFRIKAHEDSRLLVKAEDPDARMFLRQWAKRVEGLPQPSTYKEAGKTEIAAVLGLWPIRIYDNGEAMLSYDVVRVASSSD